MTEEENKTAEAESESEQKDKEEAPAADRTAPVPPEQRASEHTTYKPMSEKKARIIRWSIGAVLLVVFAVIMIVRYCC